MNPTILVTGATGNVGREVVNTLQADGIPCRIGVRNPAKSEGTWDNQVEVCEFDFLDSRTFEDAFKDIKSLFLVRPPRLANVNRDIAPAITYAVENGIEHIVFLSLQGVENATVTPHYKIEQLIRSLDVTIHFCGRDFSCRT